MLVSVFSQLDKIFLMRILNLNCDTSFIILGIYTLFYTNASYKTKFKFSTERHLFELKFEAIHIHPQ